MQNDVLSIPPRKNNGNLERNTVTGPVFRITDSGNLHMRYTIRKKNIIWSNKNASEWLNLKDPFSQENIRAFFPTSDFDRFLSQSDENASLEAISPFTKSTFFSLQLIPFGETEKILVLRDITKPIQLEKVRTDFAANASHELRSPLTVISGYIDLMVEDLSLIHI